MCNPLLLAGVTLTGGSMLANKSAAGEVQKARDNVLAEETARQNAYDRRADAINDTSRNRYNDFTGQQSDKSSELSSYFKKQAAPVSEDANTAASASPDSGNLVVRETKKQLGKTADYTNQQNEALSNLRSFGDLLGGISRDQAADAANVQQLGSFKQGMSRILPYRLEDANSAGRGLKLFGDLLGVGGTALTMGGAAGLGGAGAGVGSGASGTGVGSFWQDVLGSGPGSAGRWLAGNSGVSYGTPFGPFMP